MVLSTATWTAVNAATAALARLDGAARLIPHPGLLRRPALRREAQSTSALEGTDAPFADVLAADADDVEHADAAVREVLNFERMAELAFSWPEDRPLTVGMLGELQRTLVHGGDWDAWVGFFAAGVAASATESRVKVERLVALQVELRERVRHAGKRGVAEQIAADLVGDPYPTVPFVRTRYGLSKQGAHNAIRALVEIGILETWDGLRFRRAQTYRAPDVMRVLES